MQTDSYPSPLPRRFFEFSLYSSYSENSPWIYIPCSSLVDILNLEILAFFVPEIFKFTLDIAILIFMNANLKFWPPRLIQFFSPSVVNEGHEEQVMPLTNVYHKVFLYLCNQIDMCTS